MYDFRNDYAEGAHPAILERLAASNTYQEPGYGEDQFSVKAKQILKEKIGAPDADIHFVSGGTQVNLIVISALLRPYEAVISAKTGHIFTNEAGAIEATGHKVLAVESPEGKLTPATVSQVLTTHQMQPHVVKPRLVYISNSTETGTFYTKAELQLLFTYCQSVNLLLFLDGARLGYALTAAENDLTLADIGRFCDVFYIGATKCGGLLGEAIVIPRPIDGVSLINNIKQKGALLAKGRLLGIQFLALFENDLYFDLARHGNEAAMRIAAAIEACGFDFFTRPGTNQLFPVLPRSVADGISEDYLFYVWEKLNENYVVVRLITSWATPMHQVDEFITRLHLTCKKTRIFNM